MKSFLFYLLQMIIASGILYGYYHLALRNKKFHQYNRFYLLAAFIISVLVPFINIPVYFSNAETDSSFILQTLTSFSSSGSEQTHTSIIYEPAVKTNWLNWQNLTYFIYLSIALIILFRILLSLRRIRFIIQNNPVEKLENIHFVNTDEPGTPFSFFRWLFWNRQIELDSDKGGQIFRHELFHIQQRHSRDIIFIEGLMVFFWINPFFYLMKKEVKAIHEFLADKFAINETQHWEYAELLLMQAFNTKQHLVNPFFHNQIKRRIAMITSSQKTSYQYLRKLLVLPVAVVIIALFAFKYKTKESENLINDPLEKAITVVNASQKEKLKQITDITNPLNSIVANSNATLSNNAINISDSKDTIPGNKSITFIDEGVTASSQTILIGGSSEIPIYVMLKEILNKNSKDSESESREKSIMQNTSSLPLVIIDGVKQKSGSNFKDIDPNTIESINVFKELSAIAKYGEEGKNGVIEIFTKKKNTNDVNKIIVEEESKNDDNKVFEKVEIEPSFPGGNTKWREYLTRNANGLIPIDSGAPAGQYITMVKFLVHSDGFLSDIKAISNHGYGMENEAIRLIAKGPKWVPAIQNGKYVNSYHKQPITFLISEENNNSSQLNSSQLNEVVIVGLREDKGRYTKLPRDFKSPSFVGGEKEWRTHLERNVNGQVPVDNGAPLGNYTTVIQFLVNADGTTSEFKSLTNQGYGMEEEALRVIQGAEHWEPSVVNGEKVNAYKKQPVTFIIMTDASDKPSLTKTSLPKPDANQLSPIYPNPSNNFVAIPINSQLAGKGEIRITDINGNLKITIPTSFAKGVNNLKVNIASLAKGMYIVNIMDASKKIVGAYKMIKQ